MKYKNRRKVWWKLGEVTHSPQKVDPVTWKILCQENIEILPEKSVLIALSFWSRNVGRSHDGISR